MLTALCMRSKAHWGYDADFMAACEAELTLTPAHLGPSLVLWQETGRPLAVARVSVDGAAARLEDLFVDPPAMGRGIGARLFGWAADSAQAAGAEQMLIDSDPFAEPFYARMGAQRVGEVPSGSIPGRMLPLMSYPLDPAAPPPQV